MTHPDWAKNATLYQLNVRQFSNAGTLEAARAGLPRIRALGVDVVYLMPVHPIGELNRKGSLGSPYAVRDYYAVNPELGTFADLVAFVDAAHAIGLYVILDWVANHTAWDSVLVDRHPEWYARDYRGDFRPTPWWDWTDIIDLDYDRPELRSYMTEAMVYWVREAGIDGYRCDVAGYVPTDFWEGVRRELDAIKPVFMLAEWEARDLHAAAFDATYAWSWNAALHEICQGRADISSLYVYYSWNERAWPADALRMTFVSNHDKNAWEGTMYEQFGAGLEAAIALSIVGEGLPLIYNGQETGNDRRLAFFERDPITWNGEHPIGDLYRRLFRLQHDERALWHGTAGGRMIRVPNDEEQHLLCFVRRKDDSKVLALFNFSDAARTARLREPLFTGTYREVFSDERITLVEGASVDLPAWGFRVLVAG